MGSGVGGFGPVAKLLLGDDLQNPGLSEETAQQVLFLLQSPVSTVAHDLTWSLATGIQQELVTWVPASLVTTGLSDWGVPPPPPPRGLVPPTRRILPVGSTEHMAEALKEVVLELEPMAPTMKKYRKYLQRQSTDDDDITTTKM